MDEELHLETLFPFHLDQVPVEIDIAVDQLNLIPAPFRVDLQDSSYESAEASFAEIQQSCYNDDSFRALENALQSLNQTPDLSVQDNE